MKEKAEELLKSCKLRAEEAREQFHRYAGAVAALENLLQPPPDIPASQPAKVEEKPSGE